MHIPNIFRPLLGISFGLTIFITSLFGNYIITMMLPVLFLGGNLAWRTYMDRAVSFWMFIPMTFLEFIFGVRYQVSGDLIDTEKPAIVIMNHRTRLDWMYYWSAIYQQNPWLITSSKISLKAQLKKLPGAGFGMAASHFIFLERNIELDKQSFDEAIDYYYGMSRNYQLLLFPEGTDKSKWTTEKSMEYASRNGLRPFKHLLYPRVAGFYHLINKMRQKNYVTYVYDVTIGYPCNIVQSELDLVLKGVAPREVHFHVTKIAIESIPTDKDGLTAWMHRLWMEKEERLERMAKDQCFHVEKGEGVWRNVTESPMQRIVKLFSFSFWMCVIFVWLYHLTFIHVLQLTFSYFFVVSLILGYGYGGIDKFVYKKWRNSVRTMVI